MLLIRLTGNDYVRVHLMGVPLVTWDVVVDGLMHRGTQVGSLSESVSSLIN